MGLFDMLNEARMTKINGTGHDEIDAQSELDGWMDGWIERAVCSIYLGANVFRR